jgi:hypothetical protein
MNRWKVKKVDVKSSTSVSGRKSNNHSDCDSHNNKNSKEPIIDQVIDRLTTPCCTIGNNNTTSTDQTKDNLCRTRSNPQEMAATANLDLENDLENEGGDDDLKALDDELAKMDIDNDFTLSLSFVEQTSPAAKGDDEFEQDGEEHDAETYSDDNARVFVGIMDCSNPEFAAQQLSRMEVFSQLYKPKRDETAILTGLATRFGAKKSSANAAAAAATLCILLNIQEDDDIGKSIVLKRGLVQVGDQDRELILLTHGFILAKPETDAPALGFNLRSPFSNPKFYDYVVLYNDVDHVKDTWQLSSRHRFSLHIPILHIQGGELYIDLDSSETKQSWLDAWERVLLRNRALPKNLQSAQEREARLVGWQHELIQTSLYTAAVTGQAFFSKQHLLKTNVLDEYNGMAPLHYAALHNQIHIIEHLCSACGADVELNDAEGRTPMYYGKVPFVLVGLVSCIRSVLVANAYIHDYTHSTHNNHQQNINIRTAERDNWKPSIDALQKAGASSSTALHRERHGALIEEARQLEQDQKEQQHATEKEELMKGAIQQQQDGSGGAQRARRSPWYDVVGAIAGLDQEALPHDGNGPASAATANARNAHSHMNDGMNALNERGQKINQLSDKTGDLEYNASEYKDLAEQVRRKLEKKNKGLNFLNPFSR